MFFILAQLLPFSGVLANSTSQLRAFSTTPDLFIDPVWGLYVLKEGQNVSGGVFGQKVTVVVALQNQGTTDASYVTLRMGIRDIEDNYNHSISTSTCNVSAASPGNSFMVEYNWTINLTVPGSYQFWAIADPDNHIVETNEDNNLAALNFTIAPLFVDVSLAMLDEVCHPGDGIMFACTFYYAGTVAPVKGFPDVSFELYSPSYPEGVPDTRTLAWTTDDGGVISGLLFIPVDMPHGVYLVRVHTIFQQIDTTNALVVEAPDDESLPWGLFAVIGFAVAAGICVVGVVIMLTRRKT